jgi:hypothetical protein
MHAGIDAATRIGDNDSNWMADELRPPLREGDSDLLRKLWCGASAERRILPPDVGGLIGYRAATPEFRHVIAHRLKGVPKQYLAVRRASRRFAGVLCTTHSGRPVSCFTTGKAATEPSSNRVNGRPRSGFSKSGSEACTSPAQARG